jgi:hypothetical protein
MGFFDFLRLHGKKLNRAILIISLMGHSSCIGNNVI